jgi:uncharacterized protein
MACLESKMHPLARMIHHDEYSDVSSENIDAFVHECELGRLVTVSADGRPRIGLYPFVYDAGAIELHLNRRDEQLADLATCSRCLFEVDDVLAIVPSYWMHAENATLATAYHRTVAFDCTATVSDDASMLAAQQLRLLARYQPEGGFRSVAPEDPMYRGMLGMLCSVKLAIDARHVKFKLGQNRSPELRSKIAGELRKRGRPNDARAADALDWTLAQPASRPRGG